jgi:hypothetical protein
VAVDSLWLWPEADRASKKKRREILDGREILLKFFFFEIAV